MKILVFGGDGFCGWPTSLHLSNKGHEVVIVDNLSRRATDSELDAQSLTPICDIDERLQCWNSMAATPLRFARLDLARNYDLLVALLSETQPDAVVHFAEQRAAPYSMKSAAHRRYSVDNNLTGTHNLLCAVAELGLDTHVVHLGTMGVYGYGAGGAVIPEGYLKVQVRGADGALEEREILHPCDPGSIYHMTKCQDQMFFYYYNKNFGLRVTDLHQGIVWGTQTDQTGKDARLVNRFDYDGDYGTVLNRFVMQAAVGHPLTVHGTGEQTRAFIHIQDTVRCVELALTNPPAYGERVRIFNQATETHRLIDLAHQIRALTGADISFAANPRLEARANTLAIENTGLQRFGWDPITLSDGLLNEVHAIARHHKHRCDLSKIPCASTWWNASREEEPADIRVA